MCAFRLGVSAVGTVRHWCREEELAKGGDLAVNVTFALVESLDSSGDDVGAKTGMRALVLWRAVKTSAARERQGSGVLYKTVVVVVEVLGDPVADGVELRQWIARWGREAGAAVIRSGFGGLRRG